MNNKILLSVLVLSYNHRDFVERCIMSALRQRSDTIDIEVIIIDDGSTDHTCELIEKLIAVNSGIILHKQVHEGVTAIARNFNKLISYASGKYIAFLSSDDEFIDNGFENFINILESEQNIQFIYGNGINCLDGKKGKPVIKGPSLSALESENPSVVYDFVTKNVPLIFIQGILARKSFFDNFLPFDETLIADDWVFNITVFQKLCNENKSFKFIDTPVFIRNILPDRTSANLNVHWKRISQVIQKYVQNDSKIELSKKTLAVFLRRAIKRRNFSDAIQFFSEYLYYLIMKPFHVNKK